MKEVRGGVTAPIGFTASGIRVGIKKSGGDKKDLALVASDRSCSAAACYTTNKVLGQPLIVTKAHLADGRARAIIANSGNANACTGEAGIAAAERMAALAAEALGIAAKDVVVASTGVIGVQLDVSPIEAGMAALVAGLSREGHVAAREAIMTTDTVFKEVGVSFQVGGAEATIGAMSKGSGMIHPNMATMLSFITTDCAISAELLQAALSEVVAKTYNMVSVDGDTSTNDMVVVLANGAAGNAPIVARGADYEAFAEALLFLGTKTAKMIARDGEGATKLVECIVSGAASDADAAILAKAVITSSLVKAAFFGADANWGRILCAMGYAEAKLDPAKVRVSFESPKGRILVCEAGAGVPFSEEKAKAVLSADEVTVLAELGDGEGRATAWGCDLTYDYVKINGDYRT